MGKSSINRSFSMAMLNNQMVTLMVLIFPYDEFDHKQQPRHVQPQQQRCHRMAQLGSGPGDPRHVQHVAWATDRT